MVQRVTTNGNDWYNEWQRVVQRMKTNESDFRIQNETIMQCKTRIYSATSFWNIMSNRTFAEAATGAVL